MSRQTGEKFKIKLVELTCEMLDKHNGSAYINMRAIARAAGCAHTNIYNYFDSFNDLLHSAMLRAMETIVLFTQERVGTRARTYEHFSDFIDAQIEFAHCHEGLFRFLWLEKLSGTIPDRVRDFAVELKNRFAELIFNCAEGKLTKEEALDVSEILHGYLHGEICKMLNERVMQVSREEKREEVKTNIDRLLKLLMTHKLSNQAKEVSEYRI